MIPNDEGGASIKRKDSLVRTIKVRDIIEAADNEDLVSFSNGSAVSNSLIIPISHLRFGNFCVRSIS